MAKSSNGVIDFNTRLLSEMAGYMPGCDVIASLNAASGKTLNEAMVIAVASAALGSPFRCVISDGKIWIDATDKTKTPYAALLTAMGAV